MTSLLTEQVKDRELEKQRREQERKEREVELVTREREQKKWEEQLAQEQTRAREEREALERERNERDDRLREAAKKDKLVEKIAMYRDGTEIEIVLNSLEAELANAGVELDEWKTILLAKITPKCKNLVLDLLQNPTTTYLDIKKKTL